MNAIAVIGFCFLLMFLEALTDAFQHRQKIQKKVIFGYAYHITQILTFVVFFIFGGAFLYWIMGSTHGNVWQALVDPRTLWLLVGYTMIRIGFFNMFFNWLANYKDEDGLGTTDIFDVILTALLMWLGQGIEWLLGKFGVKFDYRYLIMIYNIVKIGIAFVGCIFIASRAAYL